MLTSYGKEILSKRMEKVFIVMTLKHQGKLSRKDVESHVSLKTVKFIWASLRAV